MLPPAGVPACGEFRHPAQRPAAGFGNNLGVIHFKMVKDAQNQEVLHAIQELRSVFPYELPDCTPKSTSRSRSTRRG